MDLTETCISKWFLVHLTQLFLANGKQDAMGGNKKVPLNNLCHPVEYPSTCYRFHDYTICVTKAAQAISL